MKSPSRINSDKEFDKKFGNIVRSPFYLTGSTRETVKAFIAKREKQLLQEVREIKNIAKGYACGEHVKLLRKLAELEKDIR